MWRVTDRRNQDREILILENEPGTDQGDCQDHQDDAGNPKAGEPREQATGDQQQDEHDEIITLEGCEPKCAVIHDPRVGRRPYGVPSQYLTGVLESLALLLAVVLAH